MLVSKPNNLISYLTLLLGILFLIKLGIISFLYCYYRGPVQSERGLDIMRWCLQSVALCMIYYSIRCEKISLTLVLLLMATKWISFQEVVHYILTRGWYVENNRTNLFIYLFNKFYCIQKTNIYIYIYTEGRTEKELKKPY